MCIFMCYYGLQSYYIQITRSKLHKDSVKCPMITERFTRLQNDYRIYKRLTEGWGISQD